MLVNRQLYDSETSGIYTTLDVPGALPGTSEARGISGSSIVGVFEDLSAGFHGFIETGGIYTTLDDPATTFGTLAFGISGSTVVGRQQSRTLAPYVRVKPAGCLFAGGCCHQFTVELPCL